MLSFMSHLPWNIFTSLKFGHKDWALSGELLCLSWRGRGRRAFLNMNYLYRAQDNWYLDPDSPCSQNFLNGWDLKWQWYIYNWFLEIRMVRSRPDSYEPIVALTRDFLQQEITTCSNFLNINWILLGCHNATNLYVVWFHVYLLMIPESWTINLIEQILEQPQEVNQYQTFIKAFHLLGFLMFIRRRSGKRPSQLPLPKLHLLQQGNQEQQGQKLRIVREKQHQLLNSSRFSQDSEVCAEKKIWQHCE